jgi:hypothetical protein
MDNNEKAQIHFPFPLGLNALSRTPILRHYRLFGWHHLYRKSNHIFVNSTHSLGTCHGVVCIEILIKRVTTLWRPVMRKSYHIMFSSTYQFEEKTFHQSFAFFSLHTLLSVRFSHANLSNSVSEDLGIILLAATICKQEIKQM